MKLKGTNLNFVTNKSQEGAQFCKGFGGIGGIFLSFLYSCLFSRLSQEGTIILYILMIIYII